MKIELTDGEREDIYTQAEVTQLLPERPTLTHVMRTFGLENLHLTTKPYESTESAIADLEDDIASARRRASVDDSERMLCDLIAGLRDGSVSPSDLTEVVVFQIDKGA